MAGYPGRSQGSSPVPPKASGVAGLGLRVVLGGAWRERGCSHLLIDSSTPAQPGPSSPPSLPGPIAGLSLLRAPQWPASSQLSCYLPVTHLSGHG